MMPSVAELSHFVKRDTQVQGDAELGGISLIAALPIGGVWLVQTSLLLDWGIVT